MYFGIVELLDSAISDSSSEKSFDAILLFLQNFWAIIDSIWVST